MSVQIRVVEALRGMIDAQALAAPVAVGALPEGEGLSMAVTAGRTQTVTLSHGGTAMLDVALACKRTDQAAAMEALCALHETLTRSAALPSGDGWQVIAIRTASAPAYIGREGPYWLYASVLSVTYAED